MGQPRLRSKDLPLREDIRLLGRLLGDTIREQEGAELFDSMERIRQMSIGFHRDQEPAARAALEAALNGLHLDSAIKMIRSGFHFSQLANLAEDHHRVRQARTKPGRVCHPEPAPWPLRWSVSARSAFRTPS